MTRKLTIRIFGCFLLSLAIVGMLWALSKDIREKPGSFLRQYPPHPAIESKLVSLDDEHYYFAGATEGQIYLGNTRRPLEILIVEADMSDTTVARLDLGIKDPLKFFRITVRVDSPYYYFMDGAIPYVFRGNIDDWKGTLFLKDSTYFIDAVPISYSSFAICALSAKTNEKAIGKIAVNSAKVTLNHHILKKQFDGVFDVDGSLTYDRVSKRLIYMYYYRNEYMVMDTNLNLEYRGNTIDTFATAQVKTKEINSKKVVGLSAPPLITNKSQATYGQWLFIHSLLPSKNEDMEQFDKASTVDVYDMNLRRYQFSFFIFDEAGEKMKSFKILDHKLYALFDHSIRSYDLLERYFPTNNKTE